jgi:hypothetical protein
LDDQPQGPQAPPPSDNESRSHMLRTIGLFGIIVSELLGITGVGMALGYLAWSKWGFPMWTIGVTTTAGLAFAFYRVYLISKKEWGA